MKKFHSNTYYFSNVDLPRKVHAVQLNPAAAIETRLEGDSRATLVQRMYTPIRSDCGTNRCLQQFFCAYCDDRDQSEPDLFRLRD